MKAGKAGSAKLDQAKATEANAVMNADQKFGSKRDALAGTAPALFNAAPASQAAHDREVIQQAYYGRIVNGIDTAGGRLYIGNSAADIGSRPIGSGRQTKYESFGPFSAPTGKNWILIYNDPE
ncbi:MAG: hypothetical protein NTY38_10920 [Acidobacteria bacterium]|nr:hypothetical protein [Acidobacteriota bacterium]